MEGIIAVIDYKTLLSRKREKDLAHKPQAIRLQEHRRSRCAFPDHGQSFRKRQSGVNPHRARRAACRQVVSQFQHEGECMYPQLLKPGHQASRPLHRQGDGITSRTCKVAPRLRGGINLCLDDADCDEASWVVFDDAFWSSEQQSSASLEHKAARSAASVGTSQNTVLSVANRQEVHWPTARTPQRQEPPVKKQNPKREGSTARAPTRQQSPLKKQQPKTEAPSVRVGGAYTAGVDLQVAAATNRKSFQDILPKLSGLCLKTLLSRLAFGPASFSAMSECKNSHASPAWLGDTTQLVQECVEGAASMRGQRGERLVTEMMTSWCSQGLFMHGPPDSPVNSLIIPAAKHIFATMAKLDPKNPKRVDCLLTLALACQDCQQVQAREILRFYGDLTSQNATLEDQLKYTLMRDKEAALNCFISKQHPRCDLDHTQVSPWQQRVHLFSGYLTLIGEAMGMDGVAAARSDRFLSQSLVEISNVDSAGLMAEMEDTMSVACWLQTLLADINNQAADADRLIDRSCIFKWAQASLIDEHAYLVFYDEDRAAEFVEHDPQRPEEVNQFQPFLSCKILIAILVSVGLLTWHGDVDLPDEFQEQEPQWLEKAEQEPQWFEKADQSQPFVKRKILFALLVFIGMFICHTDMSSPGLHIGK